MLTTESVKVNKEWKKDRKEKYLKAKTTNKLQQKKIKHTQELLAKIWLHQPNVLFLTNFKKKKDSQFGRYFFFSKPTSGVPQIHF